MTDLEDTLRELVVQLRAVATVQARLAVRLTKLEDQPGVSTPDATRIEALERQLAAMDPLIRIDRDRQREHERRMQERYQSEAELDRLHCAASGYHGHHRAY